MVTALSVRNQDTIKVQLPLPASGELEAGRLVKLASGAPAYCDAGDVPLAQVREPVSATDPDVNRDRVTSVTLASGGSVLTCWCDDAVAIGATLYTAANGTVSTTPSNGRVGTAVSAKASGTGLVTVAPDVADLS